MEIYVTIGVIVGIFGVLGLGLTWGRKIVTRQDLENLEARLDAKMDARFAEFERKFEDFERKIKEDVTEVVTELLIEFRKSLENRK